MFPKCFYFVMLIVVSLQLKGAACFFVKHFWAYAPSYGSTSVRCLHDTGQIQSSGSWGNLSFLEFSANCLDPAAQFRFRDNGAMLNLKRKGCLAAFNKNGSGYDLDMFYLYVDSVSLDTAACVQKPNESIYRAVTQTPEGGLSVYYKGRDDKSSFQTWCAWYSYNSQLYDYGIERYMGLSRGCQSIDSYQRFIFGSVTCYGDNVKNANCPKDQYMVVKFATYRGLLAPKTCGLSDDYSCAVDVTCLVKKQCDGLHECNLTVDDNLFSGDRCPGLSNYLNFEYQCVHTVKPFNELCVHDVSLSYSSVPYEGVIQITTDNGTKNVCWQSLQQNDRAMDIVCSQLGYDGAHSLVNISTPTDAKNETFSGSINCNSASTYLSQCSVNTSASESCSELSYIQCDTFVHTPSYYYKPLLQDRRRFPDSSFSASASSRGHSDFDARISSGNSWCAPVSDYKHYLQVDLGRQYVIGDFVTYGDSTKPKWVATYNLNYTTDLVNWKTAREIIQGNKNAYDHADWFNQPFDHIIFIRALRFIPLTYVGQPCMRVQIWAKTVLPDKPTNLTVTNIKSRSAEISWQDPKDHGIYSLSRSRIKLKKENFVILTITIQKVNERRIYDLTPFTSYEIFVAAETDYGFGEESISSFLTSEEAPSGPPLNIRTTSRSASSLSFAWDPPETTKQNGVIINYTACVSHSENGPYFQTFTTRERKWLVRNLNTSTKYFVRVLASTKVGHGIYSESEGFFTNGRPAEKAIAETSSTLTFSLKIPTKTFVYFYVVALKLKDGKEPASSDSYENNELVTYDEAENSTNPKPYIAAVVTSSDVDGNMFVLGDGRNTSNSISRKRRSPTSDYFNGPLEPDTSYSVFQRIIINEMGEYYSTAWSPPSKTSEDTDHVPGDVSDTDDNDGFEKYLVAIIIASAILLVILCVIAYCIYQTRRLKSNTDDVHHLPSSQHDDIGNYEQVHNEEY